MTAVAATLAATTDNLATAALAAHCPFLVRADPRVLNQHPDVHTRRAGNHRREERLEVGAEVAAVRRRPHPRVQRVVQLARQLRVLAVDVQQQQEAVEIGRAGRHAVLGRRAVGALDVELLRERERRGGGGRGGGGRLAQRHRRLEPPAVLPERRAALAPERQEGRRAAGVAGVGGAASAVLGWLVAALGGDLGGAGGEVGGLAAPRRRLRAPLPADEDVAVLEQVRLGHAQQALHELVDAEGVAPVHVEHGEASLSCYVVGGEVEGRETLVRGDLRGVETGLPDEVIVQ